LMRGRGEMSDLEVSNGLGSGKRTYATFIQENPFGKNSGKRRVVRIPALSPCRESGFICAWVQKAFCTWITGPSLSPS